MHVSFSLIDPRFVVNIPLQSRGDIYCGWLIALAAGLAPGQVKP